MNIFNNFWNWKICENWFI